MCSSSVQICICLSGQAVCFVRHRVLRLLPQVWNRKSQDILHNIALLLVLSFTFLSLPGSYTLLSVLFQSFILLYSTLNYLNKQLGSNQLSYTLSNIFSIFKPWINMKMSVFHRLTCYFTNITAQCISSGMIT